MTAQVFDRSRLGTLTKVAQGGQGVVYQAPNGRTKFSASIVYKEYKAPTLAEIDFVALRRELAEGVKWTEEFINSHMPGARG